MIDKNHIVFDLDINPFGEIFALVSLSALHPYDPFAMKTVQAFMLFSPSGSLMKAEYYDNFPRS